MPFHTASLVVLLTITAKRHCNISMLSLLVKILECQHHMKHSATQCYETQNNVTIHEYAQEASSTVRNAFQHHLQSSALE